MLIHSLHPLLRHDDAGRLVHSLMACAQICQRSMRAPSRIPHGGRIWRIHGFCRGGKVWVTLCLSAISALLTHPRLLQVVPSRLRSSFTICASNLAVLLGLWIPQMLTFKICLLGTAVPRLTQSYISSHRVSTYLVTNHIHSYALAYNILDTLEEDVECIRKLCGFTNVIPVIAKSDLMSSDQIAALKSTFQKQTRAADAKPFLFGNQSSGQTDTSESQMPFAVSSAKSNDEDTMDASTLMSPDYVQPLVPSELNLLVRNLFDRDHLAWMRHSASKKLVQRQYEQQRPMQSPRAHQRSPSLSPSVSILTSPNHSLSSASFASPAFSGSLDYTLARITDHTQREEGLAQVHLVKWAADLQRSLQNERERYAAMARGERAAWLTERLSECVVDGSLVPTTTRQTPTTFGGPLRVSPEKARGNCVQLQTKHNIKYHHITGLTPHDPLGVVWWTDDLRQRGWKMFQIVGSFGVVGGLALWLANFWGYPPQSLADVSVDWW